MTSILSLFVLSSLSVAAFQFLRKRIPRFRRARRQDQDVHRYADGPVSKLAEPISLSPKPWPGGHTRHFLSFFSENPTNEALQQVVARCEARWFLDDLRVGV